jgi:hypothetical protein
MSERADPGTGTLSEALQSLAKADQAELARRDTDQLEAILQRRFRQRRERRRKSRLAIVLSGGLALTAGFALFALRRPGPAPLSAPTAARAVEPRPERAAQRLRAPEPPGRPPPVASFVPLGGVDRVYESSNLRVVRVQLPAITLASLGWPSQAAASGGTVLVDALLGEDGAIRALRPIGIDIAVKSRRGRSHLRERPPL